MKPRSDWALSLSAWAIRVVLRGLGATWRMQVVGGEAAIDRLVDGQPFLISFWHNQSLVVGWFLRRFLYRRGLSITLMASHSRDGEILARVGRAWGLEAIRGSASRGGSSALRRLYRAVTRGRSCPMVALDGPRGPIYECKVGVVVLAQTTGAPIQPFASAARSAWRLGSWDRLIVPWPFTTIKIAIGEPLNVPGEIASEDLGAWRERVKDRIHSTTRAAQAALDDPT